MAVITLRREESVGESVEIDKKKRPWRVRAVLALLMRTSEADGTVSPPIGGGKGGKHDVMSLSRVPQKRTFSD